jgi:hypothetical protein
MAFTKNRFNIVTLQVATHLSETATFQSSPGGRDWTRVDDRPQGLSDGLEQDVAFHTALQRRIKSETSEFTFQNSLNHAPVAKTAGLTSSPLGDQAAFVISMHPGNMTEYTIPMDERATLCFARQEFTTGEELYPQLLKSVKDDLSVEALLCILRTRSGGSEPARIPGRAMADGLENRELRW